MRAETFRMDQDYFSQDFSWVFVAGMSGNYFFAIFLVEYNYVRHLDLQQKNHLKNCHYVNYTAGFLSLWLTL